MKQYIAAVQMNCVLGDVKKNTDTVLRALTHLKESERGTELAVFPEMCLYGYDAFEHLSDPGTEQKIRESLEQIAQMCKKISIDAVIGAPYFLMVMSKMHFFILTDRVRPKKSMQRHI